MKYSEVLKKYGLPCSIGNIRASHAVCGMNPDRTGGRVIMWAYSANEAIHFAKLLREAGCHNISITVEK